MPPPPSGHQLSLWWLKKKGGGVSFSEYFLCFEWGNFFMPEVMTCVFCSTDHRSTRQLCRTNHHQRFVSWLTGGAPRNICSHCLRFENKGTFMQLCLKVWITWFFLSSCIYCLVFIWLDDGPLTSLIFIVAVVMSVAICLRRLPRSFQGQSFQTLHNFACFELCLCIC